MKTAKVFLTLVTVFGFVLTYGQENENNEKLQISGNYFTSQRFLTENGDWAWNENRLTIDLSKKINDNSSFYSELWIRNFGLPQYANLSALSSPQVTDPIDFQVRQAYFKVKDFLLQDLDFTVGRQIINWGTADKINPTNNLNPDDFEDILDFGRKRGVEAIKADYYFGDNTYLELVGTFHFRGSNLPTGIFSDFSAMNFEMPQGINVVGFNDSLILPDFSLKNNLSGGLRLKTMFWGIDMSASYVYGYDYLPYAKDVSVLPVDMNGNVIVNATMDYHRRHVIGFDMASSVAGIGIWSEAALFIPEKDVVMQTDLSALYPQSPTPVIVDSVLLAKDKPYLKYVLGADYTFGNGIYVNFQYIHGFLQESGRENLNDYYFLNVEKSFFYDKLKVRPLSGAVVISDYSAVKDNYAIVYVPNISYKPVDNAEIVLSCAILDGKGQSMFSALKDLDMIMLKFKYDF